MKTYISILSLSVLFLFGCQSIKEVKDKDSENIRLNQLGYYPGSVKQFAVVNTLVSTYDVIDSENVSVFSGELVHQGTWDKSDENLFLGDFSKFTKEGEFRIVLDNGIASYPFEIKKDLYNDALNAAIKSFYYQRASMEIDEKFGGIYSRGAGHPDDKCMYHESTGKEGILNSPGGWYDAGDYGKYTVNAAITIGQMLNLIEMYPEIVPDGSLNIPESGNGIGDLWDEIKYELDWLMTMQDDDGGVYHKLTALNFAGFIMPEDYDLDRYIIGKATAATLDFAAVMAQASRLYRNIDSVWSEKALIAAENAFIWALENDDLVFRNPKDVSTGGYGDNELDDEFYWAAAELYITTKEDKNKMLMERYNQPYQHQLTNSWKFFTRNVGFHSLLNNRETIHAELAKQLVESHIQLADEMLVDLEKNPYKIALEHFEWGSNSDILNQAMIFCFAHKISGDEKYLVAAEQNTDYIFGKNATGFSFLTGFGSKQAIFPHHRPSGADGIDAPVPGFIIGGPNPFKQDARYVEYKSDFPAKAYEDVQESFASNEVCLNWNAPAVFVLGYLQQNR